MPTTCHFAVILSHFLYISEKGLSEHQLFRLIPERNIIYLIFGNKNGASESKKAGALLRYRILKDKKIFSSARSIKTNIDNVLRQSIRYFTPKKNYGGILNKSKGKETEKKFHHVHFSIKHDLIFVYLHTKKGNFFFFLLFLKQTSVEVHHCRGWHVSREIRSSYQNILLNHMIVKFIFPYNIFQIKAKSLLQETALYN